MAGVNSAAVTQKRQWFAGLEGTSGVAVLPNRPLLGKGEVGKKQTAITMGDGEERGSYFSDYRVYRGLIEVDGKIDFPVSFEELPFWLALLLGPNRTASTGATAVALATGPTGVATDGASSGTPFVGVNYFQIVARYGNSWQPDAMSAPGAECSYTSVGSDGVSLRITPAAGVTPASYDVYHGTVVGGAKYYLGSIADSGSPFTTFTAAGPAPTTNPAMPRGSLVATAPVVLASQSVSASTNYNATANPPAPAPLLLTVSGASGWGTITLAGTNAIGASITEQVTFSGNGTKVTANGFATIGANGIQVGAGFAGATLKIASTGTYYFTPSETVEDLPSATIYWGDNLQAWYSALGALSTLQLQGALGKPWSGSAAFFGADLIKTTFPTVVAQGGTFSSYPAVAYFGVENALTHATKVYIDPVTGSDNFGTTAVTGEVISATFSVDLQRKRRYFTDNRADMEGVSRGQYKDQASLVMEWNDTQWYDNWQSDTPQRVRLAIAGTAGKMIAIDLSGKWTAHTWSTRDNNVTAQMDFTPIFDSVLGAQLRVSVANGLAMVA